MNNTFKAGDRVKVAKCNLISEEDGTFVKEGSLGTVTGNSDAPCNTVYVTMDDGQKMFAHDCCLKRA